MKFSFNKLTSFSVNLEIGEIFNINIDHKPNIFNNSNYNSSIKEDLRILMIFPLNQKLCIYDPYSLFKCNWNLIGIVII